MHINTINARHDKRKLNKLYKTQITIIFNITHKDF